jgi:hypothetical protein
MVQFFKENLLIKELLFFFKYIDDDANDLTNDLLQSDEIKVGLKN